MLAFDEDVAGFPQDETQMPAIKANPKERIRVKRFLSNGFMMGGRLSFAFLSRPLHICFNHFHEMPIPPRTSQVAFPSTRWSLVQSMQKGGEAEAAQALNEICRHYWYPIYAFTRRHGFSCHDAEDITQGFFQRIVSSEAIKEACAEKGRLRSFMLGLLKRVISNHVRHVSAKKRGGSPGATVSFDDIDAESRYLAEPADVRDPTVLFDRAWAEEVLHTAEHRLREDFARGNNLEDFERLREYLPHGENATPYPQIAATLGISEGALRLQIHRMRKRYAKLIEEEITQTVDDQDEAKAELEHLMKVIGA